MMSKIFFKNHEKKYKFLKTFREKRFLISFKQNSLFLCFNDEKDLRKYSLPRKYIKKKL